MIKQVELLGGATPGTEILKGCRGFRIIGSSIGATYTVDGNGPIDIQGNDSPVFALRPAISHEGARIWRYPEVQFIGGAVAPLIVMVDLDESEGDPSQPQDYMGGPAPATYQEGDIAPAATSIGSESAGTSGIPILIRNGNTLIIPPGNAAGLNVQGNRGLTVFYDTTTGAGLAQDTGVIANATNTIAIWIEIGFSAVLTGSRTLDIRLARPDGSQISLFEVAPRVPAPTLAVGRLNSNWSIGLGVASTPANQLDGAWGMLWPNPGASGGLRVNLGAGGAETARIRLIELTSSF